MNTDAAHEPDFERRRFLAQLAAAAAAGPALAARAADPAEATPSAAELVLGKDARLIVHSAKPVELETPIALLAEHRLTPKSLIFVRNNQSLAGALTTEPARRTEWAVDIVGLVEYPGQITVQRLEQMEQVEVESVLQCSGNGRAYFSEAAPAKGSQWHDGAMANVRFGGVKLRHVLDALGVNISPQARFVTAEGKDSPLSPKDADFEHSIPLDDALERSLLALRLNGEPLPAVHGGPVRLVTPGYYGTMNVKWVNRLRIEDRETYNHHQVHRYRTPKRQIAPGSKFTYDLANSEPNWRMRTKSVFFNPRNGQRLSAGDVQLSGVAFNDGTYTLEAVEVSSDRGKTWTRAALEMPGSPYAWHHWKLSLKLPAGEHELRCRAIDARGRTQPADGSVDWNPSGYAWSGVETVRITVG